MARDQDTTPQPSEKDRLHAQHSRLEQDLPPTPTSISLGSPISPINQPGAGSSSVLSSPPSISINSNDHAATPPPYSAPASTSHLVADASGALLTPARQPPSQPSQQPRKYPGLPPLNYHLYSPPLFELSPDCTTIKSTAPYLSSTASALIALVRAQATIPPKPQIHIIGRRGNHKPDFALKLNLMHLLVPDGGGGGGGSTLGGPGTQQQQQPQQRMDYLRCVGTGEMALRGGTKPALEPDLGDHAGLAAWARRFIEDPAPVKAFVLERTVVNLDTHWLEGQIRSLVAGALGYRGVVTVTFPVTHARVVVQSPDRVNKFFTGLTTLFAGRKTYEVVKAVWPFASCKRDQAEGSARVCAVQSEEQWWKEWAEPIRFAIATRRNGWVTNEDKLEALMEGKGKGLAKIDWGDGGTENGW